MKKNFTVHYAPDIDREKLHVRINEQDKPTGINWWDYVEIKVIETNKSIVCKLRGDKIKEIPPEKRKPSLIYLIEPLRDKLGIEHGDNLDFEIKKKRKGFFINWYYFIRYHPNDTVVVSTWLGILAITLGILAIVLTLVFTLVNF